MSGRPISSLHEISTFVASEHYDISDLYKNSEDSRTNTIPLELISDISAARKIPTDDDEMIKKLQSVPAIKMLQKTDFKQRQYILQDAICKAARNGNIQAARTILSTHPYLCLFVNDVYPTDYEAHYTDFNGQLSALHEACRRGDLEFAKLLITHGANIQLSISGKTPLSLAIASDNPELITYLEQQMTLPDQIPLLLKAKIAWIRFTRYPPNQDIIIACEVIMLMIILVGAAVLIKHLKKGT